MIFILMAQVIYVIQVTATLGVKPINILEKEMDIFASCPKIRRV